MNTQQAFDTASVHLLKQGYPAKDLHGACKYRSDESPYCNLKCAIGALIPDSMYQSSFEGMGALDVFGYNDDLYNLFKDADWGVLGLLQNIHDNTPPAFWYAQLRALAKRHDLSTEELDKEYDRQFNLFGVESNEK